MKVAVTGATGRLGSLLLEQDWSDADLVPWTRQDADLSDGDATAALFRSVRPSVVVHTAASTDLVRCEEEPQYCWDNVALPTIHVARGCAAHGARLLHVSTDYVFSGREPKHPIPPDTRPDPVNYYAMAKVAAESAARVVPDHCVLRTTMKPRGPWKHPQAPTDMWMSHAYYDEVAPVVRDLALSDRRGIVQFGARDINVFEFARQERPDVRGVPRSSIKTLALPGDIRMERNL